MSKEWESGFLAGWVNLELLRGQSCKEFAAVLAIIVASQELVGGGGDCNRSLRLKVSDVGHIVGGQLKLRLRSLSTLLATGNLKSKQVAFTFL